jgi:hypothetical protein
MRIFYMIFLFASLISSAQKPLEVTIDSIASDDSNSLKRNFNIHYHIKNTTAKPVSFFALPDNLIANAASSMTLYTVYKIYQNNEFQDMDGPFFPDIPQRNELDKFNNHNSPEAKNLIRKINEKHKAEHDGMLEDYRKNGGTNPDEKWIIRNQKLLQSKMTLQSGEVKNFMIPTHWDRIRTVTNGDIEYYLNEKDHFELELILDLKKTAFKGDLSETEFAQIMSDTSFIESVFSSNKMNIDFGK